MFCLNFSVTDSVSFESFDFRFDYHSICLAQLTNLPVANPQRVAKRSQEQVNPTGAERFHCNFIDLR